tara:strand:- start:610 stop:774 length:165 start_codon:yes stop_codon:yes gene_type:complete
MKSTFLRCRFDLTMARAAFAELPIFGLFFTAAAGFIRSTFPKIELQKIARPSRA